MIYGTSSKTDLQNFHSQQRKIFRGTFNIKIDHILSVLIEKFVLVPQLLYVIDPTKIFKALS